MSSFLTSYNLNSKVLPLAIVVIVSYSQIMAFEEAGVESEVEIKRHPFLPESYEAQKIDEMMTGEAMLTRCWALKVLKRGESWLHPDFEVYDVPDEKNRLIVIRTAAGYVVDLSLVGNFGWSRDEDLLGYDKPEDRDWIKIIDVIPGERDAC